jgi:hypothetical protein
MASEARADVLYGTIEYQNGAHAGNLRYVVACQAGQYSGTVGANGDYKIYVREQGVCSFRLFIGQSTQPAVADIRSYDEPVRYDFEIVGSTYGYGLRRK